MKRLLLIVCFFQPLFSEINVLDLKNTFACLQGTENEMLSPLVGAVSWHSDWMKNFYRFADSKTMCSQLVHELFYYNEQTGHFAITKSSGSFAAYLDQNNKVDALIKWYVQNRAKFLELSQVPKDVFEKEVTELLVHDRQTFFPSKDFPKARKVVPLLKKVVDAFRELAQEKIPFPPFVLDQTLATYWFIAQPNKDSIPDYVELLLGEKCTRELPASYESTSLRKIMDYTPDRIATLFEEKPEELAVFLLNVLKKGKNPPFVAQKNYDCGRRVDIPDCVESTLRNFFNFILFDGNRYNFDLLPKEVRTHVNPQLREFYDKFPLEETLSDEAGQAWFLLISNLHEKNPSIRYTQENCELDGDEENIVKVINAILNTNVRNFFDFASLLSTDDRQVKIKHDEWLVYYLMNIEDRSVQFLFEKGHAECKFVSALKVDLNQIFEYVVHQPIILSLLLLALDPSLLLTGHYFDDHDYLALGRNLADPNILVDIIESITKIFVSKNPDQESYCSWITAMLNDLQKRDKTLYEKGLGELMKAYDYLASCAKGLLDKQATPQNLLFIAAEFGGAKSFIEHVLAQGVQIDGKNWYGSTPLSLASGSGNNEMVKTLLDAGAKIEEHCFGGTPLIRAAESGNAVTIDILLKAGAHIHEKSEYGTPIMRAATHQNADTVKALLEYGADINEKDKEGWSPLMMAAGGEYDNPDHIIEIILDAGADVSEKNRDGQTALILAVQKGFIETIKNLLAADANIDERDKDGNTALIKAAKYGVDEVVKILLDAGAKIDKKNNEGKDALAIAREQERNYPTFFIEIIDILSKALEIKK